MNKALLACMLLAMTLPAGWAAVHPVPLAANTDSAKCVECHQDKTQGKSVHSAIATGCLSCHELRVTKDVTRIKLITTTPAALCVSCHADKNAAELKGKVHPPAVRDCLKCHDPHTSDNKNQLLKPEMGDTKADNLCLSCHTTGLNVPKDGSRHAALDMGCDTCHTVHKVGDRAQREFAYHLTKATPQLCLDCHDPKDEALVKAHDGQPFAQSDCVQCHNPHQSDSPKLMQAFQHAPFEARSCDTCHAQAKDGKVVLANSDSRALCLTCHEDKGKQIETAKVQHPGAAGECIDCHTPHASRKPGLTKENGVGICLNCHSDIADAGKKAHVHQPAFDQGCATCHQPHGGDNAHLLRVADTNSLCLECHGPDARPEPLAQTHLATIFDGKVKLPDNYFRQVPRLPLRYGRGHPVNLHPVSPVETTRVKNGASLNCLTCHQPHSSARSGMLVNDQANNAAFCNTCHGAPGAK